MIIRQTDGRAGGRMDGQTCGHTDDQRETIIPRHYRVTGYKNDKQEHDGHYQKDIESQAPIF